LTNSRSAFSLVALAFLWSSCGNAEAQTARISSTSVKQQVLSLDFTNHEQRLAARVGQQIEISLGTVGPKQYGTPEISSPAIRLESVAQEWPPNPGGPGFVYIFEATSEGEAQVKVPIINGMGGPDLAKGLEFSVTIRVGPAAGKPPALHVLMTPDQANNAPWRSAWTSLFNVVQQTFTPSLPRLTGVELDLVVANPGPASADVTLGVMNAEGIELGVVSKTVPVNDCHHVLFVFPRGGLPVSPGQFYSVGLSSVGSVFGWKYVVGGYPNGAASFNGKPLLRDTRSTFLFRTFGAS
jgi:hypothetical protein